MKKLAIIGCGGIGGYHLRHFLDYTDVELAGFCDLIPERAEEFVKRAGKGKAFTDFKVMYDEIEPDMVFICIPPYAHGEIELETIRRRIPFFVEKPIALDLELARKINALVMQTGLITACGFQCRYSNIVDDTKRFAKENEIIYVNCNRFGGIPGVKWWRDKELSGGQIVEQTIHNMDMIRYIIGEPVEV
ncbi:MAG: Gfo/Idh/MocA family oxidoreductase, partial [Clostridiales bacterium]|nr:Gfo/Idh/MocA family oxidoreductase [Clostridiales bacterium]